MIGSHNGWLIEHEWQAKEHGLKCPEVDSKLIYQKLIQDELKLWSLTKLHGAMALAFKIENRLYLYRRESKPLFVAHKHSGLYYSSRAEGLALAGLSDIIPVFCSS
jgi:hypothetical protein